MLNTIKVLLLVFATCLVLSAQQPLCSQSAIVSSTSTIDVVLSPTPRTNIRICSVTIQVKQSASAVDFGLVQGTGTNCGTGQTNLTPQWAGVASVSQTYSQDLTNTTAWYAGAGKNICLKLSAAPTAAHVHILYGVY